MVVEEKGAYKLQNPYRSVILLGHNFVEVVFWFTCGSNYFSNTNDSLIQTLMDNTIRIFTFNYEKISGGFQGLQFVFFAEVLCGIVLTVVSLAKFIGELPHIDIVIAKNEEMSSTVIDDEISMR